MITCDISFARKFIEDSDYFEARKKADDAFEQLKNKTGPGSEWLGWRDILAAPNDAELEQIGSLGEQIRSKADVFIVCGIVLSWSKSCYRCPFSSFWKQRPGNIICRTSYWGQVFRGAPRLFKET